MKALILKEIRECGLVLVVGIIALGAAMAGVIDGNVSNRLPMVSDLFHAATAIGYPALGVWLGMTQIMVDRRRGRWDFVIHRPVSGTRIFLAKAIVGSVMYLLAGIIPLLGAAAWLSAPGHFAAPFDWHMLLPRAADLFSGLVWYPAGMLVGARNARWFGSRIFPLGLALLASFCAVLFAMNFAQALIIYAVALAILFPAAWGAFVYGGEYEPQPVAVRFLQGVSVGPAIAILMMVGVALSMALVEEMWPGEHVEVQSSFYQIETDGRIFRMNTVNSDEVTDLDGKLLPEAERREINSRFAERAYLNLEDYQTALPREPRVAMFGFQNSDSYARLLLSASTGDWYYMSDRGTIEGFDRVTRRYIGGAGPGGFSMDPRPFGELLQYFEQRSPIFAGAAAAYFFDPDHEEIRKIFTAASEDPILGVAMLPESGKSSRDWDNGGDAVIRTLGNVFVVGTDGHELFHVALEHGSPHYWSVDVARLNDGRFMFHYGAAQSQAGREAKDWFVESDEHGNILSRREAPSLMITPAQTDRWWEDAAVVLAIPPGFAMLPLGPGGPTVAQKFGLGATGLACAAAAIWLLRRYAPTTRMRICWAIIALATGLTGLLLLVSLKQRVASVRCENCGALRPVTEETCPRCRAGWGAPKRVGIEILEPV